MKIVLLTGDLIKPQLFLTSRFSAFNILQFVTGKNQFSPTKSKVKLLGYNTEHTTLEQVSFEQLKKILEIFVLRRCFKCHKN